MFTGLIEETGQVESIRAEGRSVRLSIRCSRILPSSQSGDSICVDGCCLTAEQISAGGFSAFASPETMKKTSLGERKPGDAVNLERSLTLQTRLGGHLVTGHVDGTGVIRDIGALSQAWEVRVEAPADLLGQLVPKGSVAVDGISLTVVDVTGEDFSLWIIPETWKRTTLSQRRPGARVNIETDLIGKYVQRFMEQRFGPAERDRRLRELLQGGSWGAGEGVPDST